MYQEYKITTANSMIDTIWYTDSSEQNDYWAAPELNANLIIKLYPNQSEIVLSGTVTKQKVYPYVPDTQYLGVRFRAGYAYPHRLIHLHELSDTSIQIPDNIRKRWNCLDERLNDIQSVDDKLAELHRHMMIMTANCAELPARVQQTIDTIYRYQGCVKVHNLCRYICISERQLERLFKQHLGIAPKLVCKIVRMRAVLDVLWQAPTQTTLSELALQFGYTDQSHLANDFRATMGMSISEYLQAV